MLSFAEELLLLLCDEHSGNLAFVPERALNHAFAGAALMDLALKNRIDTDLEQLMVVAPEPLGDDILDPILAQLAKDAAPRTPEYWVRHLVRDG